MRAAGRGWRAAGRGGWRPSPAFPMGVAMEVGRLRRMVVEHEGPGADRVPGPRVLPRGGGPEDAAIAWLWNALDQGLLVPASAMAGMGLGGDGLRDAGDAFVWAGYPRPDSMGRHPISGRARRRALVLSAGGAWLRALLPPPHRTRDDVAVGIGPPGDLEEWRWAHLNVGTAFALARRLAEAPPTGAGGPPAAPGTARGDAFPCEASPSWSLTAVRARKRDGGGAEIAVETARDPREARRISLCRGAATRLARFLSGPG